MTIRIVFCHCREIRRFKTLECQSEAEGLELFGSFLESAADSDWDQVEDNDPGEVELREVIGQGDQSAGDLELREVLPGSPVCTVCGELVPFEGLRAHLAEHHPGAWAFETEQVWDCFRVGP